MLLPAEILASPVRTGQEEQGSAVGAGSLIQYVSQDGTRNDHSGYTYRVWWEIRRYTSS